MVAKTQSIMLHVFALPITVKFTWVCGLLNLQITCWTFADRQGVSLAAEVWNE